jgi:hypothetical protein
LALPNLDGQNFYYLKRCVVKIWHQSKQLETLLKIANELVGHNLEPNQTSPSSLSWLYGFNRNLRFPSFPSPHPIDSGTPSPTPRLTTPRQCRRTSSNTRLATPRDGGAPSSPSFSDPTGGGEGIGSATTAGNAPLPFLPSSPLLNQAGRGEQQRWRPPQAAEVAHLPP